MARQRPASYLEARNAPHWLTRHDTPHTTGLGHRTLPRDLTPRNRSFAAGLNAHSCPTVEATSAVVGADPPPPNHAGDNGTRNTCNMCNACVQHFYLFTVLSLTTYVSRVQRLQRERSRTAVDANGLQIKRQQCRRKQQWLLHIEAVLDSNAGVAACGML